MTKQILSLSDKQLKTYEVMQRIHMAWITLIVVLTVFVVVLLGLLLAAFSDIAGPYIKWAFAVIDSLLGFCLHQIIRHLFPAKNSPKEKDV